MAPQSLKKVVLLLLLCVSCNSTHRNYPQAGFLPCHNMADALKSTGVRAGRGVIVRNPDCEEWGLFKCLLSIWKWRVSKDFGDLNPVWKWQTLMSRHSRDIDFWSCRAAVPWRGIGDNGVYSIFCRSGRMTSLLKELVKLTPIPKWQTRMLLRYGDIDF
jgi:hypothetical protein